jgi:phosphoribosyl-AMP cyclohydrolase
MLKYDPQGLIPVVIQDNTTNEVLMVASMSEESLRLTRETGQTHFFSRSRNKIWHKGEESGNFQEVRGIFFNCEENSLLIRVEQHGGAACHDGYRSCYYRRLEPDNSYQIVAERVFDPATVYRTTGSEPTKASQSGQPNEARYGSLIEVQPGEEREAMSESEPGTQVTPETQQKLETSLRQLYGVYLYLRDHDLTTESNTSRLLHERSHSYLASRLADELQELAGVQSGEHVHSGRQEDTILEGSQVGYWLLLLASTNSVLFNDLAPHTALLGGYTGQHSDEAIVELRQECLNLIAGTERGQIVRGLQLGFVLIGWACVVSGVSPLAPAEYDLAQMRRKGLVE